ncbi:MAG TPA: hypothetical protein VM537_07645 [Anaerolineae bacterium]|nr:hypothetical protein [Anaerolineae bacterium]
MSYQETRQIQTEEIASGTSLTGAIDLTGLWLLAIQLPATWTAANLSFQGSADGVTYANVYEGHVELTAIAAAGYFTILPPNISHCIKYLKIRSGTGAVPVNQGGDRVLTLITRPMD